MEGAEWEKLQKEKPRLAAELLAGVTAGLREELAEQSKKREAAEKKWEASEKKWEASEKKQATLVTTMKQCGRCYQYC